MLKFSDEEIFELFGADAAEDETPERLKAFFFKNKSYQSIRANLPLRILVGHKGIGKSALLRMSFFEDLSDNMLSLWVQPNSLRIEEAKGLSLVDKIEKYKERIKAVILNGALEKLDISGGGDPGWVQGSAKRILYQVQQSALKRIGVDANTEAQEIRKKFLSDNLITVYIDDVDRGWSASKEDIANISALVNAARDLSNEERNIRFRIGLRTDAYFLFRTSDESTDKIEGNVVRLTWTNHDILIVMAMRVAKYFGKDLDVEKLETLRQPEIARELSRVIEDRFSVGRGHWDRAPTYVVLLSLTRKRPRDLIKLLSGAAREAFRQNHNTIMSNDLQLTFENYSNERMNDIVLEFRSELPDIEALLYNMRPTASRSKDKKKNFLYTNDELTVKIKNILGGHPVRFQNGKSATPKMVAEFLYKIDFIIARKDGRDGRPNWTYFDQNRMLQSQFVDFGYHWEVHPAYRWALNPKDIQTILDEIDT